MDERLEAGRHHLTNGNRALADGYLDDSRAHFAAALLQFRGPELRLGEAHALRGLAHVELGAGRLSVSEQTVREALRAYRSLLDQLGHIDSEHISVGMRQDAEEGEGSSLVLLGDVLLRLGRLDEAHRILRQARERYESLGDVASAAGVWVALGRLYLRGESQERAAEAVRRALGIYEHSGDYAGCCGSQLLLSDIHRVGGDLAQAAEHLEQAMQLAQQHGLHRLEGRATSQRAAVSLQMGEVRPALESWEQSLEQVRKAGDTEMEGYVLIGIGECQSRLHINGADGNLQQAVQLLSDLAHQAGLGLAMVRVAQHALRTHRPALALAAAESARQLCEHADPVRGVGEALRVQVKALAALNQWPAVLASSHLRAAVAGGSQPNAVAVRDFYRARADQRVLEGLDALDESGLRVRTDALIDQILGPLLDPLGLDAFALATAGGARVLVEAMVEGTREPVPERSGMAESDPDEEPTVVSLPVVGEFSALVAGAVLEDQADADSVPMED